MAERDWRQRILAALGVRLRTWGNAILKQANLAEEEKTTETGGPPAHWLELLARSEVPLQWEQGSRTVAESQRISRVKQPSTPAATERPSQTDPAPEPGTREGEPPPRPHRHASTEDEKSKGQRLIFEPPAEAVTPSEPDYTPLERPRTTRVRFEPGHRSPSPAAPTYQTPISSAAPERVVEEAPPALRQKPETPPRYDPAKHGTAPATPTYMQRIRRLLALAKYAVWPAKEKPSPKFETADAKARHVPPREPDDAIHSQRGEVAHPEYEPPPAPSTIPGFTYIQPARAQVPSPHYDNVEPASPSKIQWPQKSISEKPLAPPYTSNRLETKQTKHARFSEGQVEEGWPSLPPHPLLDKETMDPTDRDGIYQEKVRREQAGSG